MTNPKPMLDGVRVLECSLLGPAAITSHLVDLGAEVIKIEAPSGDYVRQMTWPIVEGTSLLHLHVNRGKKSVVLDLEGARGDRRLRGSRAHLRRRRRSDAPRLPRQAGLGFERLKELNPKVVMITISGYGATGPYRDLPSHGIAYDTWSGSLTPYTDDDGFCRLPDQPNIGITAGPAFGALGHPRRAAAGAHDG